jgi:hypothetical protein
MALPAKTIIKYVLLQIIANEVIYADPQLLETYNDDGEKFGGERVMKALREGQGVDVLTVCCRWYGGEMIGVSLPLTSTLQEVDLWQPIRFQHIGVTSNTSLVELKKLVILTDLRSQLSTLDDEITALRETINPPASPSREVSSSGPASPALRNAIKYDEINDPAKLGRLVTAREKTKQSLESKYLAPLSTPPGRSTMYKQAHYLASGKSRSSSRDMQLIL